MGLVFVETRCIIDGSFYDLRMVHCYFFANAVVGVVFGQLYMTSLCSNCSLPSVFISRHVSTVWFTVCCCLHSPTELIRQEPVCVDLQDMDHVPECFSRDHV